MIKNKRKENLALNRLYNTTPPNTLQQYNGTTNETDFKLIFCRIK